MIFHKYMLFHQYVSFHKYKLFHQYVSFHKYLLNSSHFINTRYLINACYLINTCYFINTCYVMNTCHFINTCHFVNTCYLINTCYPPPFQRRRLGGVHCGQRSLPRRLERAAKPETRWRRADEHSQRHLPVAGRREVRSRALPRHAAVSRLGVLPRRRQRVPGVRQRQGNHIAGVSRETEIALSILGGLSNAKGTISQVYRVKLK